MVRACKRLKCTRCERKGHYIVAKLVAQYGARGNVSKWVLDLRADCPNRNAARLRERCDLICPDLPKVFDTGKVKSPGLVGRKPTGAL
jgi:hypothetical protein